MNTLIIDSHIHIDQYKKQDQKVILNELMNNHVKKIIAVSNNLTSAKQVHALSERYEQIKPAYGYHPEQPLPTEKELISLFHFIEKNKNEMTAIGEVGLPYYMREETDEKTMEQYRVIFEKFIFLASNLNKPIILHAVYEDAAVACELLEKYSIEKAHFHWFKGDEKTITRMIANHYHISITPDVMYKERTRELVASYPLSLLMVETDGPWQFEGPYQKRLTQPSMIHDVIKEIAKIKARPINEVYEIIYSTTKHFYSL